MSSALMSVVAAALVASAALAAHPAGTGSGPPGLDAPIARTDRGLVQGVHGDGYEVFEGIPYAAPPVGDLRWRAPRPAAAWSGVRPAATPGSRCPQASALPNQVGAAEDCLYVNVTTPSSDPHSRRPTIVWLHGGSFSDGAGSDFIPRRLAVQTDSVVVTVNYRLGIFGYFGHPGP